MREPYTEDELAVLERVASAHHVPREALVEMVRLELMFHSMGRRRGLFPALRNVVQSVATSDRSAEEPS